MIESNQFLFLLAQTISCTWANIQTFDIERSLFELDKIIKYSNETETCQTVLNGFSSHASQFILCANLHAKPISMCRDCVIHLIDLESSYKALSNNSESGLLCRDILTSQDRVEIIQATYQYIAAKRSKTDPTGTQGLWNKGNCNSCHQQPIQHGGNFSIETIEFFAVHQQVLACFDKFPDEVDRPRNSSSACRECGELYQNLSIYFKNNILEVEAPFTQNICFDILDAMNLTQRRWGERFNCGRKLEHHVILLVAVTIVLILPVVFYPVVRYSGTSAEERVISQRHITDFFDQNLRRLSVNRSRFSRSSRISSTPPENVSSDTPPQHVSVTPPEHVRPAAEHKTSKPDQLARNLSRPDQSARDLSHPDQSARDLSHPDQSTNDLRPLSPCSSSSETSN